MKKTSHKVLLDLSLAIEGFSGISHDTRLTFKTISKLNNVESAGLFLAKSCRALNCKMDDAAERSDNILAQTEYLSTVINGDAHYSSITLLRRLQKIRELLQINKHRDFSLSTLDSAFFSGMLWRTFFSRSLSHDDFDLITTQKYYASNLNFRSIAQAMNKNYQITLDTPGWDFMIFQDSSPVTVSKNTTKIIRYHDAIPLSDLDCMGDGVHSFHGQSLSRCKDDSFFVCNSEPTREALIDIVPELTDRSIAIPYALPTIYKKSLDKNILKSIFIQRLSSLILKKEQRSKGIEKINNEAEFSYILALATLEPRKNYISLIRAWEMLRDKKGIKHKLVIVANKGWKYEEIINAMKPGVESGSIIHLEKIPAEEIPYLYSHASAFVFPSFNEGFGFPPMEAMQCECPVVVSDIKPHRWVMGDAALYCNPYSVDSIADAIGQLIANENAEKLGYELIANGLKRVQLYHPDLVGQQWHELFDKLKAKPPAQCITSNI